MKYFLAAVIGILLCTAPVWAQTLEWDAPTTLGAGSQPIPAGELIKYRVYAGDTQTTLTQRADVTVPSVPIADLALTATDTWLAVEAYSDVRVGARSAPVQRPPYAITFQLRIIQTIGP